MDLHSVWFLLVAVLIAGYAVLDGFDLGVGVLHLFARSEDERRVHLQAVGPVWDGNEVWLLTGGGALFAAFPAVYATVFSGFYLALMLLLFALILRAVSIEFRGQLAAPRWRRAFDWGFGVGSLLPAVLLGVAVGNILRGVPIAVDGSYTGTFLGLLSPYAVLVGLCSLAFFVLHGALYLHMKADGEQGARMGRLALRLWVAWLVLYLGATAATAVVSPHLFAGLAACPVFWPFAVLLAAATVTVPLALRGGRERLAFVASSTTIVAMIGIAGVSLYPRLVPSLTDLAYSLTIDNAASTPRTQTVMLVIALVGMPIVLAYTVLIHRAFRGRIKPSEGGHY